jgi:hypothetical protein
MIYNQLESMSDEEIDSAIVDILAQFEDNERDFGLASVTYNSKFFSDLPAAFKKRACLALKNHFTNQTNNYWNEQSENQFI